MTTNYTQELADLICDEIATSAKTLIEICDIDGMPSKSAIYRWLRENEKFKKQYEIAKQSQADMLADEILSIADRTTGTLYASPAFTNQEMLQCAKIRMDASKWLTAKLRPRKYGSKPEETVEKVARPKQIFRLGDQELVFE